MKLFKIMAISFVIGIYLLLYAMAAHTNRLPTPKEFFADYEHNLNEITKEYENTEKPFIVIDKSDRQLYFVSDKISFHFEVAFGKAKGPKEKSGDNKTPNVYKARRRHRDTWTLQIL